MHACMHALLKFTKDTSLRCKKRKRLAQRSCAMILCNATRFTKITNCNELQQKHENSLLLTIDS